VSTDSAGDPSDSAAIDALTAQGGPEWAEGRRPPQLPPRCGRSGRWQGGALAEGELQLLAAPGLADTLQFAGYVPLLRQRGIPTWLCAPRELHGLLQASAIEGPPLSPEDGELQGQGPWLPLLSLPGLLGVSDAPPNASVPCLRATPERIDHWHQRLAAEPRPLIGLGWQGNPLAEVTGGTFLSLQRGAEAEQLVTCRFRHRFAGRQDEVDATGDLLDSAALAHLAGGLGQPTWLLVQHEPDRRWGLVGEDSVWYPSLRLFRQRQPGDWGEVIKRLAAALAGAALTNVRQELTALRRTLAGLKLAIDPELVEALRQTNERLWRIEDDIREQERRQDFGARFVQLARSVYQDNDRRSALKRRINITYGSALIEEKSYAAD
jgi:hypothetical protein